MKFTGICGICMNWVGRWKRCSGALARESLRINLFWTKSLFFCKLSLSDSIIPHWFPLNRSHFPLVSLTVSYLYAVCLTQRSAFCSSPSADCSIHLFTHLLLLLLFSIPLCLHLCHRYHGMLIYKLTVKTWPILFLAPPPPLPVPSAKRKAKWWGDRHGRRQKAEWMLRIWFASQNRMRQRIWMCTSSWCRFAYLCL